MAAWLPIVKIVLPYIGPIFQAALPAFTKKRNEKADPELAQQIAELQEAVRTNAESAKALARALEEVASANDRAIRQARVIAFAAIGIALLSLIATMGSWTR
jgi:hypothetical protein